MFIKTEVEIIEHIKIAKGVFEIRFPKVFAFTAGQVINLFLNDFPPRIYSITSGESDNYLAILFDENLTGLVTPILAKMSKGNHVHISKPFGNFIGGPEEAFWIAAGTGIAPFHSMFRSGLGENKTLIHGSRKIASFYYQNEFLPALGENYIRCCSLETAEGLFTGRLTQYIKGLEFLPPTQKYYLCGSAEMVVEIRNILISRSIPFANIVAEIYF
jgi:ferredoxin--NADP+ reductase